MNFRFPRSVIISASVALTLFVGLHQSRAADASGNPGDESSPSGILGDALVAEKQDVNLAVTRMIGEVDPGKRYLGSSGEPLLPIATLVQMLDAVPSDGDGREIMGILRAILVDRAAYADALPAVVPIVTELLRERKKIPADSRKVHSVNGVSVPLGWATHLMRIVVEEIAWENEQLPPLDQQEGHASRAGHGRGALVFALLAAGLDYPEIAGYTFSLLDRCKLGLGISSGVLEQLAVQATKTRLELWNENPRLYSGAFFSRYPYTSTAGRIPEIALADLLANRDIASRLAIYSKLGNGTIGNNETAVGLASAIAAAEEGEVEELIARASDNLPVPFGERL
ncbi:hypothetical protein OAF27_02975, partial [Verrucomicrobiales bacterium]|nr:hypothetical protein [Verrucomicrobiales bacterium]